MAVRYAGNGIYLGLAADTKPTTGVATNAIFITTNKPAIHYFNGTSWTTDIPSISATNTFTATQAIEVSSGYILALKRATGTAGFDVGMEFLEHDSNGNFGRYAAFLGGIVSNTAGAFTGNIKFQVAINGATTTVLYIGSDGILRIGPGGSGGNLRLDPTGLSAVRIFTFPDATTKLLGETTTQNISNKTIMDLKETWVDKSAAYTMTDADYGITLSGTGTFTITLPAVSGRAGRIYQFIKTGASGTITIDGNASETINGAVTQTITTQYQKMKILCTGTEWLIIAN